jgi:hypothetical protein
MIETLILGVQAMAQPDVTQPSRPPYRL